MSDKTRPVPTTPTAPSKENNKGNTNLPGETTTPNTVPTTTSGPKKK
ncbi:hypothetical protein [Deinococcus yunweiensis]